MKKHLLIALLLFVITLFLIVTIRKDADAPGGSNNKNDSSQNEDSKQSGFDKNRFSLEDPASLWVVVNKKRPLPSDYEPNNLIAAGNGELLRSDAAKNLGKLRAAAAADGVYLRAISGYRSYQSQTNLYNSYVASDGQKNADTYSARPGHSEHQTGLGVDLGNSDGYCDLDVCFGDTAGGQWLAKHAHEFGFITRYLPGKDSVTGYQPEPWHMRYVGKGLAREINKADITMEEFFGLPPASDY